MESTLPQALPSPLPPDILLRVDGLTVATGTPNETVTIVEDVGFTVKAGQIVALVGESGCGKSMTALSIMRILAPGLKIVEGTIEFDGKDILSLSEKAMNGLRGSALTMVFQDATSALNPVLTIGEQLTESILAHTSANLAQARLKAWEILHQVRISAPEQRMREYPHQLSGGMRQRVMIGSAIACSPKLIVADEPTTALDVTIQRQILALMKDLQQDTGAGILLITHNLGIVAELADAVVVMYAGRVVERGRADSIFAAPGHPYTRGLFAATPSFVRADPGQQSPLTEIPGMVPLPGARIGGCAFAPRCLRAEAICRDQRPPLRTLKAGQEAACWFAEEAP